MALPSKRAAYGTYPALFRTVRLNGMVKLDNLPSEAHIKRIIQAVKKEKWRVQDKGMLRFAWHGTTLIINYRKRDRDTTTILSEHLD